MSGGFDPSRVGQARRRWVNEQTVLEELERLSDLSMEQAREYADRAQASATAEADHKRLRARRILRAQAEDGVKAISAAEVVAEADDEVATAYLLRLTSAAATDSTREMLRTIRENQNALRTAAASARDGVVGPGFQGGPR